MSALPGLVLFSRTDDSHVTTFGSAVVRVAPDTASIIVAVTSLQPKAELAFGKAREGARAVSAYLRKAGIDDFGSSQITLSSETRYTGGEHKFAGYQARIEFNVVVRELDKVDGVLCGLIAAGANDVRSVTFRTSRLKELRAEVRRRAVAAAREKAELYCQAAGVKVGAVHAIHDVNPESISGRSEGHTVSEPASADDGSTGAVDPGAITVGAAVTIVYSISDPS